MAKNRDPEPKSEESDDELISDSGSESGSDSQTETPPPAKSSIPPPNPPPAPALSASSASDESLDSDASDSESDPSPKKPDPTPKSKTNLTSTQASSSGVKRQSEKSTEVQDSKKAKKAEPLSKKDGKSEVEDSSKKLFQRVFSEDDEIVLLKGMLDFISKKKSDPVAHVDAFHDFIKKFKLLNFDVTRAQLLNKMKRLKVKYQNNASKVKDGNERQFSKEHEREGYSLSKSIWGGMEGESNSEGAKVNGSVMKKCRNKNAGVKVANEVEESDEKNVKSLGVGSSEVSDGVEGFYVYSALEKRVMSEEIKNVDREKQKEMEKKWKEIEVAELQLFAKRCEYMAEKTRLIVASKIAKRCE